MKQFRGFLGLPGYFRKFIKNLGAIANKLYEATSMKDKNRQPIALGERKSERVKLELNEKEKNAF